MRTATGGVNVWGNLPQTLSMNYGNITFFFLPYTYWEFPPLNITIPYDSHIHRKMFLYEFFFWTHTCRKPVWFWDFVQDCLQIREIFKGFFQNFGHLFKDYPTNSFRKSSACSSKKCIKFSIGNFFRGFFEILTGINLDVSLTIPPKFIKKIYRNYLQLQKSFSVSFRYSSKDSFKNFTD